MLNFSRKDLNQQFAIVEHRLIVEHRSIIMFWETSLPLLHRKLLGPENCKSFRFFFRYKPFSTRRKLLDRQTMQLVPCNGNMIGQISQKLNIGLIRVDNLNSFSLKTAVRISSVKVSINNFVSFKMSHNPFVLLSFEDLIGLSCQNL